MKFCKLLSTADKSKIFMHCSLIFSAVFFTCFLAYVFVIAKSPSNIGTARTRFVKRDFEIYTKRLGKRYKNEELQKRFENLKNSITEIESLNRLYTEARYGLTKFSDMSPEEFASTMLMQGIQSECKERDKACPNNKELNQPGDNKDKKRATRDISLTYDWRRRGFVGPILNQGNACLNCWAFSIIGVMESMLLISNQTQAYHRLSVQELTDCSTYTNKCQTSSVVAAVNFICNEHWPIIPESMYPLTLQNENCMVPKPQQGALIKHFYVKCDISPKEIAYLVATHGPVAVTVNSRTWQNYLDGVIQYHCSGLWEHTNHVVQIVGYDMSAPTPYFILRNSWGTDFGDKGYVYVAMENFLCGIGRQITYFDVFYYKGN